MVTNGVRTCDVCEDVIPIGAKYSVSFVPAIHVQSTRELLAHEGGQAGTLDENGNLRLDICLDCRMNMEMPGEETVN
jgi:hypothetical protein